MGINVNARIASQEEVDSFLKGNNPQEHIIKIECGFNDKEATIFYRDGNFNKHVTTEPFYPFCWAKQDAGRMMFGGDRTKLKLKMQEYGVHVKPLITRNEKGEEHIRMQNGYNNLWYATKPMTYRDFLAFFKEAKIPIYPSNKDINFGKSLYKIVSPNEQFMIATGKRLFKGYESYDDILRLQFDIETTGLDKTQDLIEQIGIRTNKGYEKIITVKGETKEEKINNGRKAINEFFDIVNDINPDVISGYNSENFDIEFFEVFLKTHFDVDMGEESIRPNLPFGIYKQNKQSILKLGGEMEYYRPSVIYGIHPTDCLFSVRRAQALDSNMKKATLKYVTKYSKINKVNRVYVPGKEITSTWNDKSLTYAFNNENGDWYKLDDKHPFKDGYELVTGEYIVERYLLDDLWETDKVELRFNESNFLVGKMLPVNFERMCTMGTATIWKYLLMAWSYENNLAIPQEIDPKPFTGGLSRLLTVGYIPNVQKLDYNSLYPSIILTFGIKSPIDISGAMPSMLDYFLTQREKYKALKGQNSKAAAALKEEKNEYIKGVRLLNEYSSLTDEEFGAIMSKDAKVIELSNKIKEHEALASRYDKMQLPLKIAANSYFGAFGAGGGIFPWSDIDCAEETTCCGRQMLRLMLYWFSNKGYEGIVCDSVTGDTPLFIKYKLTNKIDIKPIESIFGLNKNKVKTLEDGREYDYNEQQFDVLCRSGWVNPKFLYRHSTKKDVYRVQDNNMIVDCTKDHSLFNDKQEEIKPTEINENTKLEYYNGESIYDKFNTEAVNDNYIKFVANTVKNNICTELPVLILNLNINGKKQFLSYLDGINIDINTHSKSLVAGIQFLQNCVNNNK